MPYAPSGSNRNRGRRRMRRGEGGRSRRKKKKKMKKKNSMNMHGVRHAFSEARVSINHMKVSRGNLQIDSTMKDARAAFQLLLSTYVRIWRTW
jgi:hypothetical protein